MARKEFPCSPTEFIKVCIDAIRSGHRADETGFQEGAPSVHQHSLSSLVILRDEGRYGLWMLLYFGPGWRQGIFLEHLHSHRADSAHTSEHRLVPSLRIHLPLSEEEVHFIIVSVIVVGNNCRPHKFRLCGQKKAKKGLRNEIWRAACL